MEFQSLLNFFTSLLYARRKYPQVVTYTNKYLPSLNDDKKYKEVEKFKQFLIINQQIKNNILDCDEFKTGKSDIILMMRNFLTPEKETIFWTEIHRVEQALFPFGKPTELPELKTDSAITDVLERFKDNELLCDIDFTLVEKLKGLQDINELLTNPEFLKTVENLNTNVMRGKYNMGDLARTLTNLIDIAQNNDMDFQTKNALSTIKQVMNSVQNNENIDVPEMSQKLLKAAQSIKITK